MKRLKFIFISLLLILFSSQTNPPQSAKEIVKKAQDLLYSKSSYVEMTMTIAKPNWQRTLGMKV